MKKRVYLLSIALLTAVGILTEVDAHADSIEGSSSMSTVNLVTPSESKTTDKSVVDLEQPLLTKEVSQEVTSQQDVGSVGEESSNTVDSPVPQESSKIIGKTVIQDMQYSSPSMSEGDVSSNTEVSDRELAILAASAYDRDKNDLKFINFDQFKTVIGHSYASEVSNWKVLD